MINLVIQSFGRENEYRRAVITVLSFYAYCKKSVNQTKVLLFTDKPEWFSSYFEGLPVNYVLLTAEKIKTMRGEIDFLHRMKIALIEEAFRLSEGDLLYTDSDTFFIADPSDLIESLSPDTSYMHLHEYAFEKLRNMELPAGKTFVDFLALVESKSFHLTNGIPLTVTPQHSSWNAGVMLLHNSHQAFIPDVYRLTEQFYPATFNHASEQYAFSIVLQTGTHLKACDEVIYHYWYRIKKQIMDEFLSEKLIGLESMPLNVKLPVIKEWTRMLPDYFDRHILTVKDNAVQAFNENKFATGYKWAGKALFKKPLQCGGFLKDVIYHTRRFVLKK